MKLVIPPEIQVGGHKYSIAFNENLKDDNDYGRVNHRLQKIELNPARPTSQRVEALIHELLHVISNVYADRKLEEGDISAVSEGLLQVFQQLDIELDFSQIKEEEILKEVTN